MGELSTRRDSHDWSARVRGQIPDLLDATPRTRWLVAAAGLSLLLGTAASLVAGLSPWLPIVLALLGIVAVRPLPGLVYTIAVLNAPLGLWLIGVEGFLASAFGGRDYALSLSAAVVACILFAGAVLRQRWSRRQLLAAAMVCLAVLIWSLIGFANHGVAQTLVGVRLTLLPLLVFVVFASLPPPRLELLMNVMSWLLIANGVAAIAELVVGPARLVEWGFDPHRAVRYIDDTFRVPGLTEFNAELGMLAGAFLLGYAALWLTRDARPGRWSWHWGAVASAVCLALSTSRSGALLVAGGVLAAGIFNRSGGAAGRRRSRIVGISVVLCVMVAFVAVGATGARSLLQRFDVWFSLLNTDLPVWGLGIGSVGAATNSRVASSQHIFVDNYFVSVALQFGPVVMAAVVGWLIYLLFRLSRRSADRPICTLHIAVLAGLASASLMIEAWEYPGAMMCLALFVAYGLRVDKPEAPVQSRADQRW